MEPTEKPKLTFTLDQQVHLDKLLDTAFGRGYAKGVRNNQTEIEKLKNEIANLKLPWYRRI